MPDGMTTPENSQVPISPSLQVLREQKWQSELPDIRMQIGGDEAGEEAKKSAEYYARHYPAEGRAFPEALKTATERHQLIHFGREVSRMYEDVEFHPEPPLSDYRLEDIIAGLKDRQSAMELLAKELIILGVIFPGSLNDDGTAIFINSGFEYRRVPRRIETVVAKHLDSKGNLISVETAEQTIEVCETGSGLQRKELARNLKQEVAEMTAKQDLVKMLRWVWNQTENLEGLVEFYYKGSLTAEAMKRLCNAEGRTASFNEKGERISALTKTEGGVEYRPGHEFGDATSVALKCFEIAGLSEDPNALEELLKRPGTRELFNVTDQEIDDLFLAPGERNNRPLKQVLIKWIGQPWAWKKEVRSGKEDLRSEPGPDFKDDNGNPKPGDVRGLLTEKGNIICDSSWEDAEYIFQQIERFLGGGEKAPMFAMKDANDAQFLAWMKLRVTGMATEYGRQRYHKVDDGLPEGISHDMGGMTSCDRVKVMYPNIFRNIYKFLKTEIRDHGPDGSFGKYPERFAVHYFKTWSAKTDNGLRTFQEMRWGYRKEKIEHSDGKDGMVKVEYPEEEWKRLGELPWGKLHPKAFNAAALGPFIAGRKELGLFQWAVKTDWERLDIFKNHDFWRKMAKHMGIALSQQVVFDGRFRGIYNGDRSHDREVKSWVREQVRNYKKRYIYAFWDGLRSLPQWREWLAMQSDTLDKAGKNIVHPLERVKYQMGKTGILTPGEAKGLSLDKLTDDNRA